MTALTRRAAAALLLASPANAQPTWPSRPVRIIVPFPPGGAADVAARLLAFELTQRLGAPFLIDNKPGANTVLAAEAAARSAADGQTFLFCSNSTMASVPLLVPNAPYDPARDFAAIGMVSRAPFFLFVPAGLAATDFAGFLALARARPGELSYATNGNGTAGHLSMEQLKRAAGIDLLHVPYRSFVPALNDMLAGRIQAMLADLTVVGAAAEAGTVRVLAAATPERSEFHPDVPTIAVAADIPGFDASVWFGLFAPAGTPPAILDRMGEATRTWLARPEAKAALARIGQTPAPTSAEELRAIIRVDGARYAMLIRDGNIRLE